MNVCTGLPDNLRFRLVPFDYWDHGMVREQDTPGGSAPIRKASCLRDAASPCARRAHTPTAVLYRAQPARVAHTCVVVNLIQDIAGFRRSAPSL